MPDSFWALSVKCCSITIKFTLPNLLCEWTITETFRDYYYKGYKGSEGSTIGPGSHSLLLQLHTLSILFHSSS